MLCIFFSRIPECRGAFSSWRTISIKAQGSYTMCLFDYSPLNRASSYLPVWSFSSVVCYIKSARSSTRGGNRKVPKNHWEICSPSNETRAPKAKFLERSHWWIQLMSAKPEEASFQNEAHNVDVEDSKAVKEDWEGRKLWKAYSTSRKCHPVKFWWQYLGFCSIGIYNSEVLQRHGIKILDSQQQAALRCATQLKTVSTSQRLHFYRPV